MVVRETTRSLEHSVMIPDDKITDFRVVIGMIRLDDFSISDDADGNSIIGFLLKETLFLTSVSPRTLSALPHSKMCPQSSSGPILVFLLL